MIQRKEYEDVLLPQDQAQELMIQIMEHLADWPLRSAEAFRNAILGPLATCAINPMLGITKKGEMDFLRGYISDTIADGRMIDFGFIPNEVIKQESLRSRTMFEAGELQHPYEDWVAVTSWEGGFNGYFFSVDPNKPNSTFCIEMYGVTIPDALDIVLIYDVIKIDANGIGDTIVQPGKTIIPEYDEDQVQAEARGANCLDPLVTMLRILADASVPVTDHPEPVKLNKRRAKQGKFPIPAHASVDVRDYITAFRAGPVVKTSKGGHHASPIAHTRREHMRRLMSGRFVHVRSSKVNWRDNAEMHRLFYRVPK
jgi:hypothetical protein